MKKNKKPAKNNKHPLITYKTTLAQKAADKFTILLGSWTFIFLVVLIIAGWVSLNIYGWLNKWDPYPFILLNLFLSIIAGLQAPIILMSQNRVNQRDRIRSEYDYAVNRKAEREITEIQKQLARIERKLNTKKR